MSTETFFRYLSLGFGLPVALVAPIMLLVLCATGEWVVENAKEQVTSSNSIYYTITYRTSDIYIQASGSKSFSEYVSYDECTLSGCAEMKNSVQTAWVATLIGTLLCSFLFAGIVYCLYKKVWHPLRLTCFSLLAATIFFVITIATINDAQSMIPQGIPPNKPYQGAGGPGTISSDSYQIYGGSQEICLIFCIICPCGLFLVGLLSSVPHLERLGQQTRNSLASSSQPSFTLHGTRPTFNISSQPSGSRPQPQPQSQSHPHIHAPAQPPVRSHQFDPNSPDVPFMTSNKTIDDQAERIAPSAPPASSAYAPYELNDAPFTQAPPQQPQPAVWYTPQGVFQFIPYAQIPQQYDQQPQYQQPNPEPPSKSFD